MTKMPLEIPVDETDGENAPGERTDDEPTTETTPDVRMDLDASSAFLEAQGWGCLTLADGGAAYSIPMSFGYDGETTLYFQVQTDGDKMAYFDATTTATFLVAEVRPPDWTSVVVRGPVERMPEEEADAAYAALADNAWFPACPWTPDRDPAEVAFYRLDADEITGRTSI